MAKLSSIVVPTDFSDGASRALQRALCLPLGPKAKVTVLHVLPEDIPGRLRGEAISEAERSIEKTLAAAKTLALQRGVMPAQLVGAVVEGHAPQQILKRAHTVEADLVVIGRHGRRPVVDLFIGTTAQRVAREGDVPVLLVQLPATGAYLHPMVAVDLTGQSTRVAKGLTSVVEPTVPATLFHAAPVLYEDFVTLSTPDRASLRRRAEIESKRELQALAKKLTGTFRVDVESGDARVLIVEKARALGADLLAVGTHGRKGLRRFFAGSVAEWVLAQAPCDVLVVR